MYNAVLSVDLNELDYLSTEIVTDNMTTLSTTGNVAEQIFGISTNPLTGEIMLNTGNSVFNGEDTEEEKEENINEEIDRLINNEIQTSKNVIQQIRENSNTKRSDSELKELYDDFASDGMIVF